MNLEYELFQN